MPNGNPILNSPYEEPLLHYARDGRTVNLIVEITGMNQEKAEKKWHVENRWLPAVNAVKDNYSFCEWAFIEIANDIWDIKNQLIAEIEEVSRG